MLNMRGNNVYENDHLLILLPRYVYNHTSLGKVKYWSLLYFSAIVIKHTHTWVSQVSLVVKKQPANAGDKRDVDSIPGSGRSPGGGHGNQLQYSCLENPMDRGAWWTTPHGSQRVGHNWRDNTLSTHAHTRTRLLASLLSYKELWD